MTNEQKRKQITALFGTYTKRLEKLYNKFINQLSQSVAKPNIVPLLESDPLFAFDHWPELKEELNNIFADFVQNQMLCYRAGITDGVALAYAHDKASLTGFTVLSNKAIKQARNNAAETFIRSRLKSKEGLSLSHLVWNYASQAKSEFEVAISNVIADGLKKGTSAEALGRAVRQYLNNPDMMYRRYHRTVVDAHGNKKDIVKWRKRVIDENGKVRFVEEPLEKVGMGHYRSSRKNANRLMRTEINMSYHRANSERWQNEPFVIGIVIDLSPQHPQVDECDDLAGRYPKDFVFIGWHPQCLCMSNPITLQGDEKKEFYRRMMAGEDMTDYVSPHAITDIPDKAKAWIDANRDKFISAAERGKLGYVWRENQKYLRPQFTQEEQQRMGISAQPKKRIKTEAEKAAIQKRWDERKAKNALITKTGKNVLNVADKHNYVELQGMRSMLNRAIQEGNINDINLISKELAKGIAKVNGKAKILGEFIPNIKQHLQTLSVADLQPVYDSILKKVFDTVGKFGSDYLKQASKYEWEAINFLGGNMNGVQQKYPTTWKISQKAYLQLAQKAKELHEWKQIETAVADFKTFATKSPVFKGYIDDLDILIQSKSDLSKAQDILSQAEKKRDALAKAAKRRGFAKLGDTFSQARKDAAIWDTGNGQLADDTLFDMASKAWLKAGKKEKAKVYEYTHHYCDKNEPLQGRRYVGHQSRAQFEEKVKYITKYIERNELPEDMWFMRGDGDISVIRSRIEFAGGTWPSDLQDLVGMTMQEGGFMSTGSRKGGGFKNKSVIINIFAPKGTKAAYVEPFSAFGCGADSQWDGVQKFFSFSSEQETLFQRGTKMRIIKVHEQYGITYIDVEVIEQELKDLSYVLDSNIGY